MRINNNLMSMNAFGFMKKTMNSRKDALVKLSSGKRINSAADDAAGLAISEKMSAQIKGLGRAEGNVQDGISMLQTAEGALGEIAEVLQRMRTIAIQSSNDTLSAHDRVKMQAEVDQLASEITRISNSVEFNGKKLLNGGLTYDTQNGSEMTLQIGSNEGQTMSFGISAMDAHSLGVDKRVAEASVDKCDGDVLGAEIIGNSKAVVDGNVVSVTTGIVEAQKVQKNGVPIDPFKTENVGNIKLNGETVYMKFVRGIKPGEASFDPYGYGSGGLLAERFQMDIDDRDSLKGKYLVTWEDVGDYDGYLVISTVDSGADVIIEFGDSDPSGSLAMLGIDTNPVYGTDESYTVTFSDGIREDSLVTVSPDATGATGTGDFAGIEVTLDGTIDRGTSTINLDIESGISAKIEDDGTINDAVVNGGIDVSTESAASIAIGTVDSALDIVSGQRSKLGATHNRLEHVVNNLLTTSENLTFSESRIRDVEMAGEMMEYTKMRILMNVSQSLMAQANQNSNRVLKLLK